MVGRRESALALLASLHAAVATVIHHTKIDLLPRDSADSVLPQIGAHEPNRFLCSAVTSALVYENAWQDTFSSGIHITGHLGSGRVDTSQATGQNGNPQSADVLWFEPLKAGEEMQLTLRTAAPANNNFPVRPPPRHPFCRRPLQPHT